MKACVPFRNMTCLLRLPSLIAVLVVVVVMMSPPADAVWLTAANLYTNASASEVQNLLGQPGYRSNALFTNHCKFFEESDLLGVSTDLERGGAALLDTTVPLSTFPAQRSMYSRENERLSVAFEKVIELRLGPFRADTYHDESGAAFLLEDLGGLASVPFLLRDWADETRERIRLHLFVADPTNTLCLSLALYTSEAAATRQNNTPPLVRWSPYAFGTGCDLRVSSAAQGALGLSAPSPLSTGARKEVCGRPHVEHHYVNLDVSALEARRRGCYYVKDLDTLKARRFINCTFFLGVSGRADGIAASSATSARLVLAAAVTQTLTSALAEFSARTALSCLTDPRLPVERVGQPDEAHRCRTVELGPDFWTLSAPPCPTESSQASTPEPQLRVRKQPQSILSIFFLASCLAGALVTYCAQLAVDRMAHASARRV